MPGIANAQNQAEDVPVEESAFIQQAPDDMSSKVFFPDEITPESIAAARAEAERQEAEAARQLQLQRQAGRNGDVAQVTAAGDTGNDVAQLSDGDATQALAQLSAAERRVLIDAVEGTDICERGSEIPAIKALCENRIETRSAEFARPSQGSAEDRLLGGGLDADRVATLQAAIDRLAGRQANSNDFSNQVIASVALNSPGANAADATAGEGDPTAELSQETQALVSAIVQQLGGGN